MLEDMLQQGATFVGVAAAEQQRCNAISWTVTSRFPQNHKNNLIGESLKTFSIVGRFISNRAVQRTVVSSVRRLQALVVRTQTDRSSVFRGLSCDRHGCGPSADDYNVETGSSRLKPQEAGG